MFPSWSRSTTSSIPQTRATLSTMASSTGCTSVGDRLMIPSTSAVAVWCSRASRNSALRSLSLLEQANVLDGDDRLVGEGFKQRDVFFCKRTNLLSPYVNDSNRSSLSEHRHCSGKCARHYALERTYCQETRLLLPPPRDQANESVASRL